MPPNSTRTPSDEGPPGCFGRFRGDTACEKCPALSRCEKTSQRLTRARTLDDVIVATRPKVENADVEPDELVVFAQRLCIQIGMKKPFSPWSSQYKWGKAMAAVHAACSAAGWSPRMFVRAQCESLIPIIARGWPLKPGHFLGDKAQARFVAWVARRRRAHGTATVDRVDATVAAADRRRAAVATFGLAYLAEGQTKSNASKLARRFDPAWSSSSVTDHERLVALRSAVASLDPDLPRKLLVPTGAVLTWKRLRRLVQSLAEAEDAAVALPPDAADPEHGAFV